MNILKGPKIGTLRNCYFSLSLAVFHKSNILSVKDICLSFDTFKGGPLGRAPDTFVRAERPPTRRSLLAMRETSGRGFSWTNS